MAELLRFLGSAPGVALLLALGVVGFFYGVVPLIIKGMMAVPERTEYSLVEPGDPSLPAGMSRYIAETSAGFLDQGFTFLTYLSSEVASARGYVALLANDARGQLAQITFTIGVPQNTEAPATGTSGIILETHFADGFVLQSVTIPAINVFKDRPSTWGVSFHGLVASVPELLAVHAFMQAQMGHGAVRPSGASADPAEFMTQTNLQVMQTQARHHLFTLDEGTRVYRPTVFGAYIMTWKSLWPWKQVIRAQGRRLGQQWYQKFQERAGREVDGHGGGRGP